MTAPRGVPLRFAIAVVGVFAVWTLLLLGLPYSASLGLALKIVVFGLPAYALPRLDTSEDALAGLGPSQAPKRGWIALSTVLLTAYLVLTGGWSGLRPVSPFFVASAVVISPLVEEFAFRGVLLQQLGRFLPFAAANAVTSLLFVLYHIPLWLARGQAVSLMACLWVAAFSLWVGYVMRRSESLWTCVIVHAIQNLLLGAL